MKKKENRVLGRGLEAMLGEAAGSSSINDVPIASIKPNPDQPRQTFDDATLAELASSIKAIGLVQPITLRKMEDGAYMIISGERRWRACHMAGLTHIPAYIKTANDDEMMEMALIENIQREDLNAIEIALAYRKLIDVLHLQQDHLSERVGKSRGTISNYLRLLKLPAEIQIGLTNGKIDMGHARTILSLQEAEDRLKVYALTVEKGLSVREVERLCKAVQAGKSEKAVKNPSNGCYYSSKEYKVLSKQLSKFFDAPVALTTNAKGKGKMVISFSTEDELMHIIERLEESQEKS